VESKEGVGSTFYFTVPFLLSDKPLASRDDSRTLDEAPIAPLSILVAEDNDVSRLLVGRLLAKQGHTVTAARTGLEALTLYEQGTFDLILMDIQMPDMDGFEATAEIRERESADRGTHSDHCPDRPCDQRRSRALSGGRHGRLSVQAYPAG
jgi:response regulator RpfG family c-di-GMP phosphodiesterase